jgi:site-specific DNA recombinase
VSAVRHCVLYARLSVTKEESVSIDRQLEAARKYAEGRGWKVVGEFVDDGVSATSNRPEDRKGWNDLLRTEGFEAVVIWKVDRLARRVLDFLHVDEILRGRGVGLVAVEDPIDMTTPMGRAFATILAVFGEMEAAAIASRVKAARAHLLKEGRWPGGGVPYGYKSVGSTDGPGFVLAKDPERIGWLIAMVKRAQAGETVNAITTWLNKHGAPLPAKSIARKEGRPPGWNRQTVQGLLRNPILAGMTPRNPGRKKSAKAADPFAVLRDESGSPVVDESLAIISFEEFESLVKRLDARATPQARKFADRQPTSPLLSKVALCDDCDVFLCRGTNQKRPVLYCPQCRQTMSRGGLDPYLEKRLLTERGDQPHRGATVRKHWAHAWDDKGRRDVLLSQLDTLRIRRGVVGRRFDSNRVSLTWQSPTEEARSA